MPVPPDALDLIRESQRVLAMFRLEPRYPSHLMRLLAAAGRKLGKAADISEVVDAEAASDLLRLVMMLVAASEALARGEEEEARRLAGEVEGWLAQRFGPSPPP
ncbi:MAG: hypothetical protein QXZ09_05695 [Candidatus Methanomethylicaceae archaeon]